MLVRAGVTVEIAAKAAGVSERSFHRWMARGKRGREVDDPYHQFAEAIEQAHATSEIARVARMNRASAKGSWRASAWLLERRFPERWSKEYLEEAAIKRMNNDAPESEADDPFNSLGAATLEGPTHILEGEFSDRWRPGGDTW